MSENKIKCYHILFLNFLFIIGYMKMHSCLPPYRHAEVILTAAEKESFSVIQVIPDSQKSKEIGYCKQGLDNDSYDSRVNFEFF
jgi:hypothetical protein